MNENSENAASTTSTVRSATSEQCSVTLSVIAAIAALLVSSCSVKHEAPETKAPVEASRVSRTQKGEPVVKLDHETQERIALVVAPLEAASLRPQITAFGRVMDPSPLVAI